MIYLPKIKGERLQIYNATNGSILRSISLPTNADYNFVVSGEFVVVSITFKNGSQRSRTYDMKTGALKSDLAI